MLCLLSLICTRCQLGLDSNYHNNQIEIIFCVCLLNKCISGYLSLASRVKTGKITAWVYEAKKKSSWLCILKSQFWNQNPTWNRSFRGFFWIKVEKVMLGNRTTKKQTRRRPRVIMTLTCSDTNRMSHSSLHMSSTVITPEMVVSSVANTPICRGKMDNDKVRFWSRLCVWSKYVVKKFKKKERNWRCEYRHLVNPVEVQLLAQGYVEKC